MERIDLKVKTREETGKGPARRFRQRGRIPAVVYGAKAEPVLLTIDASQFKLVIKGKAGENVIVNLALEQKDEIKTKTAMIQEVQKDPIKGEIVHVDFHEIDLKKKTEVYIPITLVGKAEGVKNGGILQQIERDLQILCMPLQIPDRIEVDVSDLNIGDSIHVRNVSVEEGVTVLSSGDKTIVTIASPVEEEVEKEEEEIVEEGAPAAEEEEKTAPPESD